MGNQNLSAATLDKLKPNLEFQQFLTVTLVLSPSQSFSG
jgi:hypothetical protein